MCSRYHTLREFDCDMLRSMSGMAVAQQLHWIVHNLKIDGARYRQEQQQRQGSPKNPSPDDVGFIIAVPTRNAGM